MWERQQWRKRKTLNTKVFPLRMNVKTLYVYPIRIKVFFVVPLQNVWLWFRAVLPFPFVICYCSFSATTNRTILEKNRQVLSKLGNRKKTTTTTTANVGSSWRGKTILGFLANGNLYLSRYICIHAYTHNIKRKKKPFRNEMH